MPNLTPAGLLVLCLTIIPLLVSCAHAYTINSDPQLVQEEIHSRLKRQSSDRCNLADIIFCLDSSGSIGQDNWVKVLNFTKSVAGGFIIGPEEVQIGVVYYGNRARVAFNLNEYGTLDEVYNAIDDIRWLDQNTNTSGGIWMMTEIMFTEDNGKRMGAPALGIVITDGVSTRDPGLTIPAANAARDNGILMFAIGITDQTNDAELRGIANQPSEDFVFEADDFNALTIIRDSVVTAACQAASECTENGDVVVLLDVSGSVGAANFQLAKDFIEEIVMDSNIDTGEARMGLATFSSDVVVNFHLNRYNDRIDMANAVQNLVYRQGTTNTGRAIETARTQMFQQGNGDRSNFRNTLVIFTDGGSDDMTDTLRQAALTKDAGIAILGVAIGEWVNQREMAMTVSYPSDLNVFSVQTFEDFGDIYRPLRNAICNDGVVCGGDVCQNGGVCVDATNGYFCLCPTGFAGPVCQYECRSNADIALILQSSSSLGESQFYELLGYSKEIVLNLNLNSDQHRLALVTYATSANTRFNLNTYDDTENVLNAMDYIYTGGVTNTQGAIEHVIDDVFTNANGARDSVNKVAVLLSDGFSSSRDAVFAEAVRAHGEGVGIFTAGYKVKGRYSRTMLKGITSDPDDMNYVESDDVQGLMDFIPQLIDGICQNAGACSSDPCLNGGVCVEKYNGYECQCSSTWTGANCDRACSSQLDLCFVIDSSGSIRQNRFDLVKQFIHNITEELEVRPGAVHVALVTYSDSATRRFSLETFTQKEDVLHAIDTMPYTRGRTNAAAALQIMMDSVFTGSQGDRSDVPNIALVFTDGHSNVQKALTVPNAIQARVDGAHIMVVSVENIEGNMELRGMSSDPDSHNLFSVNSYADLELIVENVVSAMCDDVNECESAPCQNGGECVDGLGMYLCVCSGEWSGVNCERSCGSQRDIAVVLDASGSVDYDYEMAQELAREVIQGLNFNQGRTRLGVVTYQNIEEIAFVLNDYTSKQEVLNAVSFVNDVTVLGTNTAAALDRLRLDVFTSAAGDRGAVENWVLLVSDGRSNINEGNTIPAAVALRNEDVRILTVGLGSDVNRGEIEGIASSPQSDNVFYLDGEAQKESTASAILDQICQ